MKSVTLQLSDQEGNLAASVTGEFTPEDLDLLRLFQDLMSRVAETALMKRGIPGITNMKWEAGAGMQFTCAPYTNPELHELLHVLRPVMLEEEQASFHRISALLGRRFSSKTFAAHQKAIRHLFEEGELSGYMQITVGDQKLLHNSLLRVWLNGTQYHTDAEKYRAWQSLEASLNTENARAVVMNQLQSRVKALLLLQHVVTLVLRNKA